MSFGQNVYRGGNRLERKPPVIIYQPIREVSCVDCGVEVRTRDKRKIRCQGCQYKRKHLRPGI